MAEAAPSTLKRLRSSLSPPQDDYPNKTRATTVEPELKSFNDEEAQEWRTSLQAEALEQVKEDAELEAGVSDFVRLEDLDEGIKSVLAGITSKRPNEALVEFRKLLQSDDGGNLLHQYVLLSPKCAEIMSVWSLGPGAEPAVPLLQLLRELMKHPMGRQESSQHRNANRQSLLVVRVRLDRLARSIVSTKLKDIYAHLTSGERSRQCAALLLMSSIVKRGSLLASEVATTFDFTLNALPRLSKASKGSEDKKREIKQSAFKRSTRFAFIEFALSFLEVCHAALLRWVLQIRPLYTGLLHKLASDDETTIISVLRVLQCKVLDSSAMVPPGLQSAIFGDATLEQLAIISSNSLHLEAAQIANDTLLLLCTDPSHGICPEANLSWVASPGKTGAFGGGQGRLVRLMLKLRATENQNHRDLLLSIAAGRPMLVAAYFESFPYSLEPRVSTAWFAAVSLISDIILVTKGPPPFTTLATQGLPPPSIDSSLLQGILRSALPRNLTRLIINRGLLHANMLVKHGCLRMLLEVLSAVEFYLLSISKARRCFQQKHCMGGSAQPTPETMAKTQEAFDASVGRNNPDFDLSVIHDMVESSSGEESVDYQKWLALEKHFQNELRTSSPDPQVLLSMLSLKPVNIGETSQNKKKKGSLGGCTKVLTKDESLLKKKHLLMHDGDNPFRDDLNDDAMDHREDQEAKLVDIWNADSVLIQTGDLEDIGGFLNAKLLEVLAVYQRIIPMALVESSFDIFKILPEEPVSLTSSQQKALLMLLLAASGETPGLDLGYMSHAGCENLHLRHLYRHLKPLVKFMLGSKVGWIREQAQFLAHRAMISSGAFESSNSEIGIWLQFLPLCDDAVVSFLCDAVDTVGRNIDKYVDTLLSIINSAAKQDVFTVPQFGPLLVCVLDKCLRVLASSTRNLKIPQRTSISIYVANALDLLLQSQAHPKALGIVLNVLLCNKKGEILGSVNGFRSEWSPLQNLLLHVQWILRSGDEMSFFDCSACHLPVQSGASAGCFAKALKFCNDDERSSLEAKASALSSCLLCLPVQELAENLPLLMEIFFSVFKGKLPALMGLFSSYKWLLSAIVELWPDLFEKSVALASSLAHSKKANFKRVDLSQQVSKESSLNLSIEENELSNFSASSGITIFAFSVFLLDLPFAIIFPAAANTHEAELLTSDQFSSILEAALSEVPRQLWLSTASLILFWVEELWNLHCKGSDVKYQLENCFSLLKSMIIPSERPGWFSLLQAEEVARVDLNLIADFIRGVLAHPVMNAHLRAAESSVSQVLFGFVEGQIGDHVDSNGMESWFCKGRCALSLLDCHTVDILTELLQWASELPNEDWPAAFVKNCQLVQKVVLISCKPFLTETFYAVKKAVIENQKKNFHGIFPTITTYMAYAFSSYIDIESVLDLSCTLLSKEPSDQKVNCGHSSALSMPYHNVGLYFATSAFDRIGRLIRQKDSQHCNVLKDSLLQNLYEKVLRLVMTRPSERVFACFLSALEAHHSYNLSLDGWLHKSSVAVLSHCIHKTPTQVLTHLMMDVDKTKAKIVLHLVQVSQFYLAEFSEVLSCNLGLASAPVFRLATLVPRPAFGNADYSLKDMILLLPAVNWLINAVKCQEHVPLFKMVEQVTLVYFKVITEITKDWDIFSTDLDMPEVLPFMKSNGPSNEFAKLFGLTTSGQVILMLKHCLVHHPFTIKEREKLFISMMQKSYPLIDSSIRDVGELSLESTLKLVSVMIAKSMMAKMLMLPDILKEDSESVKTDGNSLRGLGGVTGMETEEISANSFEVSNVLIRTLGVLFEQKAFGDKEEKDNDGVLEVSGCQVKVSKHKLLHFLEMALLKDLKDVFQTSADVKPEAQHMAMLKKFTKMVLRFRFGDRLPMQVLRCFASRMAQIPDFARRYAAYGLDLLVGHSHFASTLLSFGATPKHNLLAGCYNQKDTNVRSLASVLSFLRFPLKQHLVDNSTVEAEPKMSYCSRMQCDTHVEGKKLELLKFLRVLYFLKRQASGLEVSAEPTLNSNELLSLLLAAYGATLSEVDKENFLLMQEIESFEGAGFSGLVGMDYLWGEAALKRRQTKVEDDEGYGSFGSADQDTSRELHKRCFKEDLMLEPTRCALGVLFFPLRRNILSGAVLLAGGYEEEEVFLSKPCQSLQSITEADERVLKDAAYDPCFILPFALHSLSSGWINADDFVLKGLLALTLVSVASAEEDMRKLGYETLAKFFTILEEGPSFKGKPQIRLLLTFVKNTVLEPWQRLPFVVALFAAEASCVLMNPSDIHYSVVNKFLFRAPGLDLESIPLFKPMFGSGSIHFRADRAWILRLLAFGLRTSFDTRIYRRRFIIEILMSFYTSPLGDRHTREWILQILHRASKLRSLVQYLIEHVGLLSWLASVICSNGTAKSGEYAVGVSNELALEALQIFENALSWRSVKRWLILDGFEELSKLAMLLNCALVQSSSFSERAVFIKPFLRILGTAFSLSHGRKKFQSRLNFSIADFIGIIQLVETENNITTFETRSLALRSILESSPPACCSVQEKTDLCKFGTWALTMVLRDHCVLPYSLEHIGRANPNENAVFSKSRFEVEELMARILGWLAASLILGELQKGVVLQSPATAWAFLRSVTSTNAGTSASESEVNKNLLRLLINLQCLSGTFATNASLVSVVCSCVLLLPTIRGPCGTFLKEFQDVLEEPLSQVSSPCEVNISWRWRPSIVRKVQSASEYETCQMLIALFQKLLHIEENTDFQRHGDVTVCLRAFVNSHRASDLALHETARLQA